MCRLLLAVGLLAASLVGAAPASAQTAGDAVPSNLAVPDGQVLLLETAAQGVQIYVCRARADGPSAFVWTFQAPEARLFNSRGEEVGRHYAGPTWEGNDGSRVVGAVQEQANSPDPTAIPWLLLQARSHDGAGVFSTVTYVHIESV